VPGRADLRRERGAAQLLGDGPARTPVEIVRQLLAVQAQDLGAARLALRARSPGLDPAAIDATLERRELVRAWLCRGTLHLVAADDWAWLLALTAPGRMAGNARRLGQEGVPPDDAERAVAIIERALADEGPLTRAELAERVAAAGVRTEGQATPHLLALAALRGIAVLVGDQTFAHADGLPGAPLDVDRDAALAELGRRYLRGHAPATDADLAAWSGLPLRDARAGLRAAGEPPAARDEPPDPLPRRLLPAFDPYLVGWKDRSFAVPAKHARRVHPGGGMLRAVALDDGVAVGTWTLRRGTVAVTGFDEAPLDGFGAEAADVARFALERLDLAAD
jgi:hypothetical protein